MKETKVVYDKNQVYAFHEEIRIIFGSLLYNDMAT